jgi:hypothetical protein
MQKTTIQFWIKSIMLLIITATCFIYLAFTFFFNFLTGSSKLEMGLSYYLMVAIHIIIMIICFLYLYEKVRQWKK